jgi:hypothetical protein
VIVRSKIGSTRIAECVVASVFPIPRHLCVANVAWSLLPYEADLLAMTGSGYLIEVEIKISLSDLKRDAGKAKWRWAGATDLVSRFYYAMPEALWSKPAAKECVREGAGVIVVHHTEERGYVATIAIEATRTTARPLTTQQRFDLARVGSYRAWSPQQRHRQRQLRAEHELECRKREERLKQWAEQQKQAAA